MSRTVDEWIGRTDDSMPSSGAKDRIRARQNNRCALTDVELRPGIKVEYDHIVPLWLGGRNAESNLQAVTSAAHKLKTGAEAKVRGKTNRTRKKHLGIYQPKSALSNSRFKKCMDGTVVDRRTGEIVGS